MKPLTEIKPSQNALDNSLLARARDNQESEIDIPRGNCEKCGKQLRTPKDTKLCWFWLGWNQGVIDYHVELMELEKK